MKTKFMGVFALIALTAFADDNQAAAQETAFTYQGRLTDSEAPANGSYDLSFSLYNVSVGGTQAGATVTNLDTAVNHGWFTVTLDFGPDIFTGATHWLDIAARTNSGGTFTELSPRQQLMPVPYAIFADAASNLTGAISAAQLSGALSNNQLVNSSVTLNIGAGLGGGGTMALGGATTLSNTGVLSIAGNADIIATVTRGAVTLSDTATSEDLNNTLVRRNKSGSFTANSLVLDGDLTFSNTNIESINSSSGTLLYSDRAHFNLFLGLGTGNSAIAGQSGPLPVDPETVFPGADSIKNVFIGFGAGGYNTTGGQNTFVGEAAGSNNVNGTQGVFVGQEAGRYNTSGYHNVFLGEDAGHDNTIGHWNTYVGTDAGNSATGDYNVAVGTSGMAAGSGSHNTWVGAGTGTVLTSGGSDTVIGEASCTSVTSASNLTVLGQDAGTAITTGGDNILIGYQSALGLVAGTFDIAIGESTMNADNNGGNIAIGTYSYESGTGANATSAGESSLHNLTSGNNDTAFGYDAGLTVYSGDNNTFIGAGADVASFAGTNLTYAAAIGSGAVVSDSHSIVIGTQSETTLFPGSVIISNGASFSALSAGGSNIITGASNVISGPVYGNPQMLTYNNFFPTSTNWLADFKTAPILCPRNTSVVVVTNSWLYTPGSGTDEVVAVTWTPLYVQTGNNGQGSTMIAPTISLFTNHSGSVFGSSQISAVVNGASNASAFYYNYSGSTGYSIICENSQATSARVCAAGNFINE